MANKKGRPTKMNESTVNKLIEAFSWGCTDVEACIYAGISKQTLYTYCDKHPNFLDQKEALKDTPTMKAKRIIFDELEKGDVVQANRVIDRKEGTKVKQEMSGPNGKPIENKWTVEFINATPKNKQSD